MNMVIADSKAGFDFDPTLANNYNYTFHNIPAGTYFVRNEYTNDNGSASRSLRINTFDVSGASIVSDNTTSPTTLNADALATADNYIANYRQGAVKVGLSGTAIGTSVHVKLSRNAFSFGTNIPGNTAADVASYIGANPAPGSKADLFQQFINSHFNSVVPSNYGKWATPRPHATHPPIPTPRRCRRSTPCFSTRRITK